MKRAIGGTDLGPIVALYRPELAAELAKYATASDVWMRLVHNIERPRGAAMQRGIDAEPRLRRAYLDAYGGSMMPKPTPWIVSHPRLPFVSVSPDDVWTNDKLGGRFVPRDGYPGAALVPHGEPLASIYVEFKSTSVFARHKWGAALLPDVDDYDGDGVPDVYQLQVQHGLEILNLDRAYLFVGFGRDVKDENGEPQFLYDETRRYLINRDRELAAMALHFAERFHAEHILTRKPPSVAPCNNKREFARLLKDEPWKATEPAAQHLP